MTNTRSKWVVGRNKKWKWRKVNAKMMEQTTKNKKQNRRLVEWTTLHKECYKLKKKKERHRTKQNNSTKKQ